MQDNMFLTYKTAEKFFSFKIKSITDTLFWFGAGLLVFSMVAATWIPFWTAIIGICFGGLFLLAGLGFYWYFALKDPRYLRGEVFHQNMAVIENMGSKDQLIPAEKFSQLINIDNPDTDNDATEENNEAKG